MKKTTKAKKQTVKSNKKKNEEENCFKWSDKGVSRNDCTYYNKVKHENDYFEIGDAVELCASGKQPPLTNDYKKSWVAEIEAFWEDKDGAKWMECRWYYAVNDITPSSRPPYRKRELFETDHISNNELGSIVQKVSVYSPEEWKSVSEKKKESSFFCENFYSPQTGYIHPIYDFSKEKKLERIHLYSYENKDERKQVKRDAPAPPTRSKRKSKDPTPSLSIEDAKEHLMLSYVPPHIPCRDAEREQILTYLRGSIKQRGNGSPLYISGMPGTGKTATVREVVRQLKSEMDFNYLEINGMKVSSANAVFSIILNFLTHKYVIASKASEMLDSYFAKPKSDRNKVLVILLDELDYLFTKNQQVIYKLFDWPNEANSRLVVIGISNTIDLPERIMSLRVMSRLSMNRVMFKPYSNTQIATIINNRLEEVKLFTAGAIDLCSRKVSAVSGDIRRALTIARRAIELMVEREEKIVTPALISDAVKEYSVSYRISLLEHCSLYQRLLLISVVLHMNAIGVDFVLLSDIFLRMNVLVVRYAKKELLFPELQAIVASLETVGIISIIPPSTKFNIMLKLNIIPDDIYFAFRDDNIAKTELSTLLN